MSDQAVGHFLLVVANLLLKEYSAVLYILESQHYFPAKSYINLSLKKYNNVLRWKQPQNDLLRGEIALHLKNLDDLLRGKYHSGRALLPNTISVTLY